MDNAQNGDILEKIVEELFERFLSDPYLSRKIPPYLDTVVLIKKIVTKLRREVLPLVKGRNVRKLLKVCHELGHLHKRLQVNEMMFFREVDFFARRLKENKEYLGLSDNDISLWIKTCKKGVALAYMESLIDDVLISFENGSEHRRYFSGILSVLRRNLERLSEHWKVEEFHFDLPRCPICEYIDSVDFVIKTYTNFPLRLRLEAEHKDFHQYLTNFLEHVIAERFEGAAAILREIILRIYTIDGLLKEIGLSWGVSREANFYGFLSDNYYSHGLLRIVVPKSESEKVRKKLVKDFLKLFEELLKEADGRENLTKYVFVFPVDGAVYIYIDYNALDFDTILKAFDRAIERANTLKTLLLQEGVVPPYGVGELDSRNFHKMDTKLVGEILCLAEKEITSKHTAEMEGSKVLKLDYKFEDFFLKALENLERKAQVLRCIREKRVSLFYQPVVDIFSRQTFGVELLARIYGPGGLPIPASLFIEFVKEENLTVAFDIAVLSTVLNNLEKLEKLSRTLFVNLFPDSLSDRDVIELLLDLLEGMGRRSMHLVLELTEHTVITNRDILEKIEKGNLTIAFDDFGSGYTNFKTVAMLAHEGRASILKVDGELVRAVADSEVHLKVVETVSEFAKELGMGVVFENVSNERIFEVVADIAKRKGLKRVYAQGYYISPPQPAVVFPPELGTP